jgi:hypothetical protein
VIALTRPDPILLPWRESVAVAIALALLLGGLLGR